MKASQYVYQYVNLRKIVLEHDLRYASEADKAKNEMVEFKTPAHVVTTKSAESNNRFKSALLKHEVTVAAIETFIRDNMKWLKVDGGSIVFSGKDDDSTNGVGVFEDVIKDLKTDDADIVEYDDQYVDEAMSSELVFSIIVNRTERKIFVVFRGSVSLKDWLIDGLGIISRSKPEIIQDWAKEGVKLHGGFSKYLFGASNTATETKYDQIINVLKEVYAYKDEAAGRDYSDYGLYVTGHSLGGGLTQLLAFALAGSSNPKVMSFLPKDKPVSAISYASPEAGNPAFCANFKALETKGKLRHIRVSNEGDAVTIVFKYMGYAQTGLNIHVSDESLENKAVVKYGTSQGFWINPLRAGGLHSLNSYYKRLFTDENKEILDKRMEELYKEYASFSLLD
jgi:hypothetical protein